MRRSTLKEIFDTKPIDHEVNVKGWLKSVRNSKKFSFLVLNDGTTQNDLQIIADADLPGYEEISRLLTGASVSITGRLVEGGKSIEIQAKDIEIIGKTDEKYPLQKKATSLEFLREISHFRARTNTIGAVFRVRNTLSFATHTFCQNKGYFYLNSPIITTNDGEGAGETFKVTSFDLNNLPKTEDGKVDYAQDFFGKEANLCVTGQLEAEAVAHAMGAVYTFGPTFRAENSNTARHLSEFWMIEPEVAFMDLDGLAELSAEYIQYLISVVLEKNLPEIEFLQSRYKDDLIQTLTHVRDSAFKRITYTEAVELLQASEERFEFKPEWGKELQTEHERYLTETHFKAPVIVTDYPKDCKAFYMKQNDDGKTVRAMDVLVPGVGEIVGGSQREDDLGKLVANMESKNIPVEPFWWYLDLRKQGGVPTSGFGLGFERVVMYVTGMSNIRDAIPFPRTPGNCEF